MSLKGDNDQHLLVAKEYEYVSARVEAWKNLKEDKWIKLPFVEFSASQVKSLKPAQFEKKENQTREPAWTHYICYNCNKEGTRVPRNEKCKCELKKSKAFNEMLDKEYAASGSDLPFVQWLKGWMKQRYGGLANVIKN